MAYKFGDVAEYRLDVELRYKGVRYKSEMCVSDDALMVVIYIYISLVFCLYIYAALYIPTSFANKLQYEVPALSRGISVYMQQHMVPDPLHLSGWTRAASSR